MTLTTVQITTVYSFDHFSLVDEDGVCMYVGVVHYIVGVVLCAMRFAPKHADVNLEHKRAVCIKLLSLYLYHQNNCSDMHKIYES